MTASVVGVGTTAQGELPGRDPDDIAIEAFELALADIGLPKEAIDGLITCRSFGGYGIDTRIGRLAGLNPRYSATLDYGTCNFSLHLAVMAIESGLASTVALMYGTNQRTAGHRFREAAGSDNDATEAVGFHGMAGPAAMIFRRHQHLYGTTEEQLGHVAVTLREHARRNPLAIFREPLTLDDYLKAPYLVEPLRRPDLCMISDGGASLIVTSTDRARTLVERPVEVVAMDQVTGLRQFQNPDNLMRPWARRLSEQVFRTAGLDHDDIDLLFVQDPASVWILQALEWLGFCEPGESGDFVAGGGIGLQGALPVNTNGGQLSEAYMWGWLHLAELTRQLRGTCGDRQVTGARTGLYVSTKGFEKAACSILATA